MGWSGGVEVLLDHGASALSRTPAQDMALHWAAYRGDVDILQQLINAGGDVNAMGDVGNRPLHLAASADRMEVSCMTIWAHCGIHTAVIFAEGVDSMQTVCAAGHHVLRLSNMSMALLMVDQLVGH